MHDLYQIPALILTTLLLPAFGHLYFRSRDVRTLLWFLAFIFVVARMFLLYPFGSCYFSNSLPPWVSACAQACALLSSGLFLGSLSPLTFRVGKVRILYVIPYILPLMIYALLSYGIFRGVAPKGPLFWIFPILGGISAVVGLIWDRAKGALPTWVGTSACILFGSLAFWFLFTKGLYWPLAFAEAGNDLIMALLVIFVFRRLSSGILLTVAGFALWALPAMLIFPQLSANPVLYVNMVRLIVMAKVVAAVGLVLVALEDELATNKQAGERERRARQELEAYTSLVLSRRRLEDFDRQGPEICRTVVANSRFEQAVLMLLQPSGEYRVVGSAGVDGAKEKALDALASRIPAGRFLMTGSAPSAVDNSQTLNLSLEEWLEPGDDLKGMKLTNVLAIPMHGRTNVEGALLLSGMRNQPHQPLRPDDLLPLEMLASRLQAVRSQTTMLEKLIDSEKYAGLGQLAGNVTQQLNNPLTVILGYASLLEEAPRLDEQERRGVEAILSEARHMRSTLESLSRIARAHSNQHAAISVPELLADLEHLHRSEFLQRSIELRLHVSPSLPRVLCHAQQLRQAVLHCLQFAMDAVENVAATCDRTIRVEATSEGNRVQIMVAHSGPGFNHPERAFDPYLPAQTSGSETTGLGLSLCATILRDNNGSASAVNLEPKGAAILLELQAA